MSVFTAFALPSAPSIPASRSVNILDHGAQPGGTALNTRALAGAIQACADAGGGRVVIPAGLWLTGPIHLRSRIDLHLEAGAELRFTQDPSSYLPVVYQQRGGIRCHNYSPFIYARDCHDIALTGSGILDGQGSSWWPWKLSQPGMASLFAANVQGTPVAERVYGTPAHGVRPPFFQTINCRDVLIEGVTFRNSPSWTVHPVWCENLTIRGVTVLNPHTAPNTDGIDPDGCRNVLVEHCLVDTGDDGICLKSGRDRDSWDVGIPCENVVIRHCRVRAGHGGFVVGSEMSSGVRNVLVHDCEFDGTDIGIRLKTRAGRRGYIQNIQVERITLRAIGAEAILVTMRYDGEKLDPTITQIADVPLVRDILIRDVRCEAAGAAITLEGLPGHPIQALTLENIDITARRGWASEHTDAPVTRNVTLRPSAA